MIKQVLGEKKPKLMKIEGMTFYLKIMVGS